MPFLVWRKADNWTAFTDGYRTWINGPSGLQVRLNTEHFEAPAVDVLKNTEYQSEFPASGKAKLTDGRFFLRAGLGQRRTSHSERARYLWRPERRRVADAVVILYASGGGSGTFRYLAAVVNEQGQPQHVASALLGDRVRIDLIVVQMIGHGPGDGQCDSGADAHLPADRRYPGAGAPDAATQERRYQSEFADRRTFFEPFEPGSASGVNIALSDVVFGNLNGDGVADAAVVHRRSRRQWHLPAPGGRRQRGGSAAARRVRAPR